MKTLGIALLICLGLYFASYSGRLIILRSGGHTPVFSALDWLFGWLPLISPFLLLALGLVSEFRNRPPRSFNGIARLGLVLVMAALPFLIHVAGYSLSYSAAGGPSARQWGPLTISEWLVLSLGFSLLGFGVYFWMLLQRHSTHSPGP